MKPHRDPAGYADLRDYAVIGDGRTAALIALDGRIDWWPLPAIDSPPVFGALLDPGAGGYFGLAPSGDFDVTRQYVEGTNVLQMTFVAPGGTVRVTVALNSGSAGRLPWTELAWRIEGISGSVELALTLAPGNRFGLASPWMKRHQEAPVARIGDQLVGLVADGGAIDVGPHSAAGTHAVHAGTRRLVALIATDDEPLFFPRPEDIDARIEDSIQSWRQWRASLQNDGPWAAAVERSALALKTLLAEDTGAISAAATTSLPERIGGPKNWDYRYAWVRDTSFVLGALIDLQLHQEVHAAMSWLLSALRRNGGQLAVFYTLRGEPADGCAELDVPGYRNSQPVRAGNDAATQTQLGTFGDLFDTVFRYVQEGHMLDPGTAHLLEHLADACCDAWRGPDAGIWELREQRHYTISKMGCWVALDRAAHLAESGQIATRHIGRWRAEADDVRQFIEQRCWSEARQSYTFYADSDELDAAVLLAGRTGFDRGPRLSSTADAVAGELGAPPAVYRYSGAAKEEGAFVACSFWMVEALAYCGRSEEARSWMEQSLRLANDVGILTEQFDPGTGMALGNVPQALSHLALINAVHTLRAARGHRPAAD